MEKNYIIKKADFAYTLYRWALDYHNSVNDLIDKQPGIQMFAVKYNNACLAYELVIKSHIAWVNHANTVTELESKLKGKYGHNLEELTKYLESIGIKVSVEQWRNVRVVNKYYSSQYFRYPPYEPRRVHLNHNDLLDAINGLRLLTQILLPMIHSITNGYSIDNS